MDETKFKNHAEKEFWEKAFLAFADLGTFGAAVSADEALAARRVRMQGLTKPGVHAA